MAVGSVTICLATFDVLAPGSRAYAVFRFRVDDVGGTKGCSVCAGQKAFFDCDGDMREAKWILATN